LIGGKQTEHSSIRIHPTLHRSHGYDHPRPAIIIKDAGENPLSRTQYATDSSGLILFGQTMLDQVNSHITVSNGLIASDHD